jgi:hypothetical protein
VTCHDRIVITAGSAVSTIITDFQRLYNEQATVSEA